MSDQEQIESELFLVKRVDWLASEDRQLYLLWTNGNWFCFDIWDD